MVALGFLCAIMISARFFQREGLPDSLVPDLALLIIISSIVGARLLYVIGQFSYYLTNPVEIIMIQKGGLVFLGGFLLSLVTSFFFLRSKKVSFLKVFDAIIPGSALGYAIGRLGCWLNGCCFGKETHLPWGVTFPHESLAGSYCPGQALHPTQLYASGAMLIAFFLLLLLYRQKRFDGQIFCSGLILYSLYRFLNEFFRFSPIYWSGLTPSQWLAIFIFTGAVSGLWLLTRKIDRPKD
jgi:phosphatidylglycerol:prolipoprotein diacylglycerol transferase